MLQLNKYGIVVTIALAVCVFLLIRSCTSSNKISASLRDSVELQKKVADSVSKRFAEAAQISDSIVQVKTIDSIHYTERIDSFRKVCTTLRSMFMRTGDTIRLLHSRLSQALIKMDTIGVYRLADSLNWELVLANGQLSQWQADRDSSDNIKDAQIKSLYKTISDLQSQITTFKSAFAEMARSQQSVTSDFQKLQTVQKKDAFLAKAGWLAAAIIGIFAALKK